jgi:hypothetical protein
MWLKDSGVAKLPPKVEEDASATETLRALAESHSASAAVLDRARRASSGADSIAAAEAGASHSPERRIWDVGMGVASKGGTTIVLSVSLVCLIPIGNGALIHRILGLTFVPKISIARSIFSCGKVETPI